jgi:hypothetical protein
LPGTWRRLSLISGDGLLTGLDERHVVGQLEELGIPRHLYNVVRTVQSWQRAAIPPDVALALWLLRECASAQGSGLPRRRDASAEDTGPTIRYLQLALAAGETPETDPAVPVLAAWLADQQLEDGGIPAQIGSSQGEVGTTARAVRVLRQLDDGRTLAAVGRMRQFLLDRCIPIAGGRAWSYGRGEPVPVTGATSLAGLALLELCPTEPLLSEVAAFLLAAQHTDGGWSEVPSHQSTIHNTFNVVRYLRAARSEELVGSQADESLGRAAHWFRRTIRKRPPRTVLDLAYALRLAVQLDLCQTRHVEKLAMRLCKQRVHTLARDADLYAETEVAAIALLEASRHLDAVTTAQPCWAWRWALPALPPPFLCHTAYLYELLYGLLRARWWLHTVDVLVNRAIVDRVAGLLLGTVAALGIVDDFVTESMLNLGTGIRGLTTIVLVGSIATVWIAIKSCAYSSMLRATRTSIWSLLAGSLVTWVVYTPAPVYPSLIALLGLRWLVIDVVAHTANASGLLNRMLPR